MAGPDPSRSTAGSPVQRVTFPCVDGLRGVAAISILVFHVAFISGLGFRHRTLGLFLARLDVGVPLFFVISGFLLYRPYVTAHLTDQPHPGTSSFLVRRLLRIVPAYWVVLAVVSFGLGLKHLGGIGGALIYFGFLQIYDNAHAGGGISQAWSLCTEMTFYLALPAYAWAVRRVARAGRSSRRGVEWCGVIGLYTGGLVVRAAITFGDLHQPTDCRLDWLPATMDLFALGMALAVASATPPSGGPSRLLRAVANRWALCWGAAAVAYVAVSAAVFRPADLGRPFSPAQVLWREALYGAIGVLAVAPAALGDQDRGAGRRFLRSGPLAWAGIVSYGIYLTHNAVIDEYVNHTHSHLLHLPFPTLLLVTGAATIPAAVVLHQAVERPAQRAKRRFRDVDVVVPAAEPASLAPATAR